MGCCQDKTTRHIQDKMEKLNFKDNLIHKLLMLGSGASGKSTIFKQLGWLYGIKQQDREYTEGDADDRLAKIRENMTQNIIVLLRKSQELYEMKPEKFLDCFVNFEDSKYQEYVEDVKYIATFQTEPFGDSQKTPQQMAKLGVCIGRVWKLEPIQKTFGHRDKYSFSDNMDYFYDKSENVFKADYQVSKEDYLKTRVRTTGVTRTELELETKGQINRFQIIDVGGQRNERNKWIHQFSTVTGVIFVAALNHFCTVLFEDETKNAMHESIELFEQIANIKHFHKTEMILFLNKDDLFIEKMKQGFNLDMCFGNESTWKGDIAWSSEHNYDKTRFPNGSEEDKKYFDACYLYAVEFITQRYCEQVSNQAKMVYSHVTNACDKQIVSKVFWDVQNMVIRINLKRGGIMG